MTGGAEAVSWDKARFDDALKRAADGAIDARGVRLQSDQLRRLLDAAPPDPQRPGGRLLREASFCETTFSGDADFSDVTFSGDAVFRTARFEGTARFEKARFKRQAVFQDTNWKGEARFSDVTFVELILDGAVFNRRVRLEVCAKEMSAASAEFLAGTDILITNPVRKPTTAAVVTFSRATFAAPSTLGPPMSQDPSVAQTIPRVVSLRGARVVDLTLFGVDLRTCHFEGAHGLESLRLEQVLLAEPPKWTPRRWQFPPKWTKPERWPFSRGGTQPRRLPPFPVRWTRRVAIAEEHRWRAETGFGWPKWSSSCPAERELAVRRGRQVPTQTPTPHQIAAIYRSLRKGQEDRKDEPGAADFYYGEMEMRRHSTYKPDVPLRSKPPYVTPSLKAWSRYDNTRRTPLAEKAVLWLYWLVSGYALRASRALAALALTVLVFAFLFKHWGIRGNHSWWHALIFSLQSTTSLFRAPEENLSLVGKLFEIGLRLLGPLFFGLALLSLRGRIKR
ncbi:MAG: pentapeptide repeat-containing protein [Solirubrobacteraceae bacterium]